jgi:hypothetical protein
MTKFSQVREDVRTVPIQADDIGGLGLELQIVTGHVAIQSEGSDPPMASSAAQVGTCVR